MRSLPAPGAQPFRHRAAARSLSASTRAQGDGGSRRAVASTAGGCGAQVVECCVGGSCTIGPYAVSRETRPSRRRQRACARSAQRVRRRLVVQACPGPFAPRSWRVRAFCAARASTAGCPGLSRLVPARPLLGAGACARSAQRVRRQSWHGRAGAGRVGTRPPAAASPAARPPRRARSSRSLRRRS
jgi:hypothetical protein